MAKILGFGYPYFVNIFKKVETFIT